MPGLVREFAIDAIEAPDTGALGWFLLNARRTTADGSRDLPPVTTVIHSPSAGNNRWLSTLLTLPNRSWAFTKT